MNEIIKLSLEEDSFSSHVINSKDEILNNSIKNDYIFPDKFDVNRMVLLAVNPSKFFIYWFLNNDTKEKLTNKNLRLKLFVERKEVLEIPVSNFDGEIYIFYHAPFKEVFCNLGYTENQRFFEILKSNVCIAPSDIIIYEEEEKWYNKNNQTYLLKKSEIYYKNDSLNSKYVSQNLPTSPVRRYY